MPPLSKALVVIPAAVVFPVSHFPRIFLVLPISPSRVPDALAAPCLFSTALLYLQLLSALFFAASIWVVVGVREKWQLLRSQLPRLPVHSLYRASYKSITVIFPAAAPRWSISGVGTGRSDPQATLDIIFITYQAIYSSASQSSISVFTDGGRTWRCALAVSDIAPVGIELSPRGTKPQGNSRGIRGRARYVPCLALPLCKNATLAAICDQQSNFCSAEGLWAFAGVCGRSFLLFVNTPFGSLPLRPETTCV